MVASHRRFTLAAVLGLIALAPPASASAERLEVPEPVSRECAAALEPGSPGIAVRTVTSPDRSILTARLAGDERSDWDLAVFGPNGVPVAASTAFGSDESAATLAPAGQPLTVQACRLDGRSSTADLETALDALRPGPGANERISLESVSVSGPGGVERLEQLGIDVTHDVSPDRATVVLYSSAERALLDSAGFEASPLIADLPAADAAAREAESSGGIGSRSNLPSGRDTYRQYADFTSELKALADANPLLVREVTIGTSLEGRPIQGVEIAQDVLRTDDGRPVYLNFGGHHAREWPSAEFPMEFARDLVIRFNQGNARVQSLLGDIRVVVVPVVNVDGFVASRSFGFNPLTDDDDPAALWPTVAGSGAYRRKNCRPLNPADAAIPCAQRTSGVDLNRNYGYYWGGEGSYPMASSQAYRGPSPFSEPESEAVHRFTSGIHPTMFITNHTFTDDGKWLRQPGFDDVITVTEDEAAMKSLGDSMGAATGWTSELGYETLGDITGAAEDWNYFAQGAYGYTPEARGPNFHGSYPNMVVTEYLGDATHAGLGAREAFLRAGEIAGSSADHGIVKGAAPPGATLRLQKQFTAPTSNPPGGPASVAENLDTTLRVGASGTYEWHVNPSSRPAVDAGPPRDPPAETWSMTCKRAGDPTVFGPVQISVNRGQEVTQDWAAAAACGFDAPGNAPPVAGYRVSPLAPRTGQLVNFISTSDDPDGAIASTEWDLDADGAFDDATGLAAQRAFTSPGGYVIAVRVTDNEGATDVESRIITVLPADVPADAVDALLPNVAPGPGCSARLPTISGTDGSDLLVGTAGRDIIAAAGGADRIRALGGNDLVCGGRGPDRITGGRGLDTLLGEQGRDRISGGGGKDICRGGPGRDRTRGCP